MGKAKGGKMAMKGESLVKGTEQPGLWHNKFVSLEYFKALLFSLRQTLP